MGLSNTPGSVSDEYIMSLDETSTGLRHFETQTVVASDSSVLHGAMKKIVGTKV